MEPGGGLGLLWGRSESPARSRLNGNCIYGEILVWRKNIIALFLLVKVTRGEASRPGDLHGGAEGVTEVDYDEGADGEPLLPGEGGHVGGGSAMVQWCNGEMRKWDKVWKSRRGYLEKVQPWGNLKLRDFWAAPLGLPLHSDSPEGNFETDCGNL